MAIIGNIPYFQTNPNMIQYFAAHWRFAQVRLRQILLRVAAAGPPVMDPIRRSQATDLGDPGGPGGPGDGGQKTVVNQEKNSDFHREICGIVGVSMIFVGIDGDTHGMIRNYRDWWGCVWDIVGIMLFFCQTWIEIVAKYYSIAYFLGYNRDSGWWFVVFFSIYMGIILPFD